MGEPGGTDLILPGTDLLPGVVFFVFVWALIPTIASVAIASNRGLRAGPAGLLGFIGGWLGLVLVIAFYNSPLVPEAEAITSPTDIPGAGPLVGARPKPDPVGADDETIRKLRTLTQLRDEGLIGPDEFEERRQKVLKNL